MNLRRKRFKKLIPELLEKDFGVYFSSRVKDKTLTIWIHQTDHSFSFYIKRINNAYTIHYSTRKHTRWDDYSVVKNTVTESYEWIKNKLISDGLLNKEELMVKDIIE